MSTPDRPEPSHRLGHPQPPKKPQVPLPPPPPIGRWQPTTPRQRRRIVLAAVLTVLVLWSLLLFRPGAKVRTFPPDPPLPVCQPGQTSGCVGGTASVQLLPPGGAGSERAGSSTPQPAGAQTEGVQTAGSGPAGSQALGLPPPRSAASGLR